jgi:hypothetical protein
MESTKTLTETGLTYERVLLFDSTKPNLKDIYDMHSECMHLVNFGKGSSRTLKNLNQYVLVEIPLTFLMGGDLAKYLFTREEFKYRMLFDTIVLMFDPVTFEYKKQVKTYRNYLFSIEKERKDLQDRIIYGIN